MAEIHEFPSARWGSSPTPQTIAGPANLVVERGMIGALLMNSAHLVGIAGKLLPEHFVDPVYALVYKAILEAAQAGRPIQIAVLQSYLPAGDLTPGRGIGHVLADCIADAPAGVNVEGYLQELLDLHGRRQMVEIGREIMEHANDPPIGQRVEGMLDMAEADLMRVRSQIIEKSITHAYAGSAAAEVMDFLDASARGEIASTGTLTSLYKLDRATGGIQPGDLWIVGGRPGMGKTVMGTTIARGIATADHKAWELDQSTIRSGSLFFSFEVNKQQITSRLLADLSYLRSSPFQNPITFGDILRGRVTGEDELWRIRNAAKRLADIPLALDWSSRLTVPQIGARVRAEKLRMEKLGCKLKCVVLDYLKFIQASDRYRGQRAQEVAEISSGLKQLAKDEGIGVVLLAQLNRQNEMRGDPRPVLSDLKESGDLEADADVVAFVYRPEYYIKESKAYREHQQDAIDKYEASRGKMELILAKNRAGSTSTLELFCDIGSSMIDNHDRRM
jgi:replicative DNA helicase